MKFLLTWNVTFSSVENWIIFKWQKSLDCGSYSQVIECSSNDIEKKIEKSKESIEEKVMFEIENQKVRGVVFTTLIHIIPID